MSPAFCRRQFLSHALLFAGAAVLLPIGRLSAAPDSSAGAEPTDAATATVLRVVRRYSDQVQVATRGGIIRVSARIRCFAAMQQALSGARDHGIAQIRSNGNLVTFEMDGRRIEVENVFHAA